VIARAREHLSRLEQQSLARDQGAQQLSLFPPEPAAPSAAQPIPKAKPKAAPKASEPRQSPPALEALRQLDPDALSPREALDALYRLQALDRDIG
jgi:DNA mismatch repair protein MutS